MAFVPSKLLTTKAESLQPVNPMMVEEPDGTHWYIIGEWTFFDEKGKIIGIRKYDKGELISEEEINPSPLK